MRRKTRMRMNLSYDFRLMSMNRLSCSCFCCPRSRMSRCFCCPRSRMNRCCCVKELNTVPWLMTRTLKVYMPVMNCSLMLMWQVGCSLLFRYQLWWCLCFG